MNEAAIFIYGIVVFAIVGAACWMIVWGILRERQDRETLDAGPGAGQPEPGTVTSTGTDGGTLPKPGPNG